MSGTTLMRQEVGVDAIPLSVATGISAMTFTYLKDDNYDGDRPRGHSQRADRDPTATKATMTDQIRLRTR